ncbi:unnamed protein product [Blepharisma stoltei]|uniref:LAGLIDADG homing endonuclease n=1 Tax=Blepharisma stoltei TaxID=1481888 RepID=A0AAU9JEF6_9CILI|nr:unnamed protein product [Blepharisma stoltei]
MKNLAINQLIEILSFLSTTEIYWIFARINKSCRKSAYSVHVIQNILKNELGLPFIQNKDLKSLIEILKFNTCTAQKSRKSKRLTFFGYATNGGVLLNTSQYWIGNLFLEAKECGAMYSSIKDKNITCAAVVGQDVNYEFKGLNDLITDHDDPNTVESYIDHSFIKKSKIKACIHTIVIERPKTFTCPLKVFLIMTSDSYYPINHTIFNDFDDVKGYSDLQTEIEGKSTILCEKEENGIKIVEFQRDEKDLQLICWGRYENKASTKAVIELQQKRCCKYLYFKFIEGESSSQLLWLHNNVRSNIDVNGISIFGNFINCF